jgi:pimeloyl-ACP methyl ester carboxylesterase
LRACIFRSALDLYYPQPRSNSENITLTTLHVDGDNVLVSTHPCEGDRALVYFGGNAEDVSLDMPKFLSAFPDTAIYLLHYQGYGGSTGKPTEKGLVDGALALFDLAHAQHNNVMVVGRSLGSGLAVHVASLRPAARLVLITPFDSLADVAAELYPYLPVHLLMQDRYESWRYAPQVAAPTLILAAGSDEVVPRSSTERLLTRFRSGIAQYIVIPGVGHNTISESPDYMTLLRNGH